jgi:tRNA(fMet)-specific endonuclease VapC
VIFLLDTDICSYLMKRSHPALIERVERFPPLVLKVSTITVYELHYGAARSSRHSALRRVIDTFLGNVEIMAFDVPAARHAGAVRAALAAAGTPIGAYDFLIAGHARSLGAAVVTNNEREFKRVDGLQVENWAAMKS